MAMQMQTMLFFFAVYSCLVLFNHALVVSGSSTHLHHTSSNALHLHSTTDESTSDASTASRTRHKLIYFDARGAAELSRVLMHVAGMEYDEERFPIRSKEGGGFETPEFSAAKLRGDFRINMDRVPLLQINNEVHIGQSRAIERYVANKCGLMGSSEEERAQIDCIAENIRDIKDKWGKIRMTGGFGPNPEKEKLMEKWFAGGELAEWLAKLEKSLCSSSSTFAVGDKLSYADVSIWHLLRDYFYTEKQEAKTAERSASCTRLSGIADKVGDLPALKAYMSNRPNTMF